MTKWSIVWGEEGLMESWGIVYGSLGPLARGTVCESGRPMTRLSSVRGEEATGEVSQDGSLGFS